ncbi:hypothetical protein AC249_AIPGENE4841 [Exaiptasia diaphana]|nr:hypothetical protein AC249_AIPGENE4841 [Exaiptasia diaphana]
MTTILHFRIQSEQPLLYLATGSLMQRPYRKLKKARENVVITIDLKMCIFSIFSCFLFCLVSRVFFTVFGYPPFYLEKKTLHRRPVEILRFVGRIYDISETY